MPKMKSHSGAKKRYKVTATGKIVREKAYRSHILTSKDRKRKRSLRKSTLVDRANTALVRAQLLLG
jgi:large subunit ribosomal protein L35